MSKKKGTKKNQDLDVDFEEKRALTNDHELTSKSKGKGKKKGKNNAGDWSDSDEGNVQKKVIVSDDEDVPKPAAKKSQKKGAHMLKKIFYVICIQVGSSQAATRNLKFCTILTTMVSI